MIRAGAGAPGCGVTGWPFARGHGILLVPGLGLIRGGDLVSTWSGDRWLRAEIPPISLIGGKKTSDEANFALAA